MRFIKVTELIAIYEQVGENGEPIQAVSDGMFYYYGGAMINQLKSIQETVVFINPSQISEVSRLVDDETGANTFIVTANDSEFNIKETLEEVMLQIEGQK